MRQTPFALVTAGMTAGLLLAASTAFAVPSQADKTFAMKAAQGGLASPAAGGPGQECGPVAGVRRHREIVTAPEASQQRRHFRQ